MHKLELLPILLVAFSSDADSLTVGIACGLRHVTVPLRSNLFIALMNGLATLFAMLLGQRLAHYMPAQMAKVAGGGLIVAIGLWVIFQAAQSRTPRQRTVSAAAVSATLNKLFFVLDNPASADRDFSGQIDVAEVYLLALALSLNNLTNGIACGILGLNPVLTTLMVMAFSVILLSAGVSAGRYGRRLLGNLAGVISGVLLLVVGVYAIFS